MDKKNPVKDFVKECAIEGAQEAAITVGLWGSAIAGGIIVGGPIGLFVGLGVGCWGLYKVAKHLDNPKK